MKKFIPATAAAIALVGGIAAGTALAFPPAPPAPPPGFEHAAFGPEGGPDRGPMGGPGMHNGPRPEMRGPQHGGPQHRGPQGGFNLEQRAEHMKERLKITDAQKPQWDALVGVMQKQQRAFALSQAEVWQKRANGETPKALTAPERMAERNKASETRLNSQREFTAAFTTLYNTMSPDQKKIADDLLSGRRHRG
ncbi:MAG TPA: Spy/CpxP family protein refolding chaperone [Alphaproteobacteria bacterium]|nr:Spy/CpxP family protein refolding chaperone [Alphaproteobacteria bacterium]